MQREALERLEELIRGSQPMLNTHIPAAVLPSNMKVESLERLGEVPVRMRAKFTTERLPDFCSYVAGEKDDLQTAVFVLPDSSGATAVIDFGTHDDPLWGEHRAVLGMQYTPEFAALTDMCNRGPHSQRGLTDWLEDWSHVVTAIDADGEEMTLAKAIAAIRRVEIKASATHDHHEGDFRKAQSAMEEVEAKSKDGKLPALFRVACQVYPSLESRMVDARLALHTGGPAPQFTLRIISRDSLLDATAKEVESRIRKECKGLRVFVGKI